MDLRQKVADAAVAELRVQLDTDGVDQCGTWVQADGMFRMVGVAEAIIRVALDRSNADLVEEVARGIGGSEWQSYLLQAGDAITGARGALLEQLDPLP